MKADEDVKAVLYAQGGPLPSTVESYSFTIVGGTRMRLYYKTKKPNGICSVNQSDNEGKALS